MGSFCIKDLSRPKILWFGALDFVVFATLFTCRVGNSNTFQISALVMGQLWP